MNKSHYAKLKTFFIKGILPTILILGLVFGITYKPKVQAASARAKKAAGVIVGAALMGATAGAAGGAKWVPLGLFGGGLTGGLIAKAAVKDDYENLKKQKATIEQKLQRTNSQRKKERYEKQLGSINQKLQRG